MNTVLNPLGLNVRVILRNYLDNTMTLLGVEEVSEEQWQIIRAYEWHALRDIEKALSDEQFPKTSLPITKKEVL